MQGMKASAVVVIALVATTLVNNVAATRTKYTENAAPAAPAQGDVKEFKEVVGCLRGCKLDDLQCSLKCIQDLYPGKTPAEVFQAFSIHSIAAELTFCTIGCSSSDVCVDVLFIEPSSAGECIDGCVRFCSEDLVAPAVLAEALLSN